MKKILAIVCLMAVASVCLAADVKKEKEEKYEVTITIVYNEVPSAEAMEIAERAHKHFKNTCKHDVKIKKVPENIGGYITLGTSNSVIVSPTIN